MKLPDRLLLLMISPWVVLSYFGFVIVSFLYFDKPIAYYFHDLNLRTTQEWIYWCTQLGEGLIYIVSLGLLALFFRYIRPNKQREERSWFLCLCVLIPYFICGVLKVTLGRARPDLLFSEHLYGFYGFHAHSPFWSMPSGHTTTIMSLVFGLSFLFSRYSLIFILAGTALVLTRIILTHHYLSDVLVSSYLAFLEVGLLVYILKRQTWFKGAPKWRALKNHLA